MFALKERINLGLDFQTDWTLSANLTEYRNQLDAKRRFIFILEKSDWWIGYFEVAAY